MPPNDGRLWVEHDGNVMPIAFNRKVLVFFRSGNISNIARVASYWGWYKAGSQGDIMYYTIVGSFLPPSGYDMIEALLEMKQ